MNNNTNMVTQIAQSVSSKIIAMANSVKTSTPTTMSDNKQTIEFISNKTSQGHSPSSNRTTSRKRHHQRKERREKKEQRREKEKMIDVLCMEAWRSTDEGDDGDGTSKEHTSTTIDASNEDKSTATETQQLLIDHQEWEHGAQEAGQEEASQQDDGLRNSGTDTDLPPLVGQQREEASSDNSMSNGSYDYHTDNDNSSIEGSDDESSNTVPGLQERRRVDSSSDEDSVQCQDHDSDHTPAGTHVPQSIDT